MIVKILTNLYDHIYTGGHPCIPEFTIAVNIRSLVPGFSCSIDLNSSLAYSRLVFPSAGHGLLHTGSFILM